MTLLWTETGRVMEGRGSSTTSLQTMRPCSHTEKPVNYFDDQQRLIIGFSLLTYDSFWENISTVPLGILQNMLTFL